MKDLIKSKSPLLLLTISTLITSIISYYIHIPTIPPILDNLGFNYNDIVFGIFNPVFRDIVLSSGSFKPSDRWFNHEVAERLATAERLCPKPYVDYKFEYPPVVGAIWFLSTCVALNSALPERYDGLTYYQLIEKAAEMHYQIQSVILIAFFTITVIYLYRISTMSNSSWKRIILFVLLPSTILYLIYNWDAIVSAFMVASLYYLLRKRYFISSLLLGLSISTKVLPILFAAVLMYDLIQKSRRNHVYRGILGRVALGLVLTGLVPYLVILTISFNGFMQFINHHLTWYCENCIYMYITKDTWSPYNRVYAIMAIVPVLLVLLAIDIDYNDHKKPISVALASLITATALNYVFSPQMMIMITSVAILVLSAKQLIFLTIADIANFGIMALFFNDWKARMWMNNVLGIDVAVKYSPWTPDSPVQLMAMVRNVILIIIAIEILWRVIKTGEEHRA